MNEKCKQNVRVLIEVIHEPINENRVLLLTNAVTFGIVPYWGDYLNKINMKIYSEGTLLSSASTEIAYRRIQSIFLWPIAIFSDTGNFDISQKVIPMHFNNILEIVRKNDGLK